MIWLLCFLATQLIEMPIYVKMIDVSMGRRLLFAFGASAITHPILWFLMPWGALPYFYLLILGEAAVFIIEGFYFQALGMKKPFYMSTVANSVSLSLGVLITYFGLV